MKRNIPPGWSFACVEGLSERKNGGGSSKNGYLNSYTLIRVRIPLIDFRVSRRKSTHGNGNRNKSCLLLNIT